MNAVIVRRISYWAQVYGCLLRVSSVGVSPIFALMVMVLPPSPNLIVVDWVLPATFGGPVKANKEVIAVETPCSGTFYRAMWQ